MTKEIKWRSTFSVIFDSELYNKVRTKNHIESDFAIVDNINGERIEGDNLPNFMYELDVRLDDLSKQGFYKVNKYIYKEFGERLEDDKTKYIYTINELKKD